MATAAAAEDAGGIPPSEARAATALQLFLEPGSGQQLQQQQQGDSLHATWDAWLQPGRPGRHPFAESRELPGDNSEPKDDDELSQIHQAGLKLCGWKRLNPTSWRKFKQELARLRVQAEPENGAQGSGALPVVPHSIRDRWRELLGLRAPSREWLAARPDLLAPIPADAQPCSSSSSSSPSPPELSVGWSTPKLRAGLACAVLDQLIEVGRDRDPERLLGWAVADLQEALVLEDLRVEQEAAVRNLRMVEQAAATTAAPGRIPVRIEDVPLRAVFCDWLSGFADKLYRQDFWSSSDAGLRDAWWLRVLELVQEQGLVWSLGMGGQPVQDWESKLLQPLFAVLSPLLAIHPERTLAEGALQIMHTVVAKPLLQGDADALRSYTKTARRFCSMLRLHFEHG